MTAKQNKEAIGMVERVAMAVYETEPYGKTSTGRAVPWSDVAESQKEGFRIKARAAIAEMREPTDAMVDSGQWQIDPVSLYQSFIDSALNEQVSG